MSCCNEYDKFDIFAIQDLLSGTDLLLLFEYFHEQVATYFVKIFMYQLVYQRNLLCARDTYCQFSSTHCNINATFYVAKCRTPSHFIISMNIKKVGCIFQSNTSYFSCVFVDTSRDTSCQYFMDQF